ncbi:hypothetical protein AGOR_G00039900 [Albula goreensis]|uniref:Protein Wnt n=1 Tax=Albula goreensis TaxID=1534307 RepID=A0A8T3DX94_9TELE|nr:hypothetical protein AGOR_G00039900 [Albula goreensis]
MIYHGCFLFLCGLTHVMASYPIWWSLAVGHQYSSLGTQPILCGSIPGLVPKQLRFCRNYVEIMPSVAEGVKIGIQECQHQFRGRRWNCTTINDNLAIFGPVLDKGKRVPKHQRPDTCAMDYHVGQMFISFASAHRDSLSERTSRTELHCTTA